MSSLYYTKRKCPTLGQGEPSEYPVGLNKSKVSRIMQELRRLPWSQYGTLAEIKYKDWKVTITCMNRGDVTFQKTNGRKFLWFNLEPKYYVYNDPELEHKLGLSTWIS